MRNCESVSMKCYYIFFAGLFFCLSLAAAEPEQLFEQANKAYADEDFESALKDYESIVEMGFESAELYYNLGNAYYKTNQIAKAILNYERAKRLAPAQPDIDYNLRLANLRVVDKVETLPKLFFEEWFEDFFHGRSSGQWGALALSFALLALLSGVVLLFVDHRLVKRVSFFVAILFLSLSLTLLGFGLAKSSVEKNSQYGIILSPNVYIKSGPSNQSQDLFILHAGSKVSMIQKLGNWIEIKFSGSQEGQVGWIEKSNIEEI